MSTRRHEQVFAYPEGIPGGWSNVRKIHFVTHSMGTQTVRYLQYLLSIDYFEQNAVLSKSLNSKCQPPRPNWDYSMKFEGQHDKKDWIASITCLNGMINGGTGPNAVDLHPET